VNRTGAVLLTVSLASAASGAATPGTSESVAIQLRDRAIADQSVAYSWVSELTTRIGPRPAGSRNDNLAAAWAAKKLQELGFENVHIETFPLTAWVRGTERAEIVAPNMQPLVIAALGGSPATPSEGVEAEVVIFPTLEDLIAAPKGSLTGKIAMVTRHMVRTEDTSGYAAVAGARFTGPIEAARRGAVGFLIRSISTDNHRLSHTGATGYLDGHPGIPAFALSVPDADQLERLAKAGQTVRVRLFSTASFVNDAHSQNVVAEIRGREHPEEVVMLGAHLDSWDQGTGAVDDGAGTAIITAAAKLIHDLPERPRRTVRIVLFGAEEVSQPNAPFLLFGGNAYAKSHASELRNHVVTSESDTGTDRIYAVRLPPAVPPDSELARTVFRVLTPLGILPTEQSAETGVDINPSVDAGGIPIFALYTDMTHYFDLHHSPDDTLDKIDRQQLNQNVAAWAAVTWLTADSDMNFRAAGVADKKRSSLSELFKGDNSKK
jgi:carboxypeptidase Q